MGLKTSEICFIWRGLESIELAVGDEYFSILE
jgi:hypothetical protein